MKGILIVLGAPNDEQGNLSSIAREPIKQSYAVTGSMDQFGRVQAIGGVNEKIEGFFAVCEAKGLTGEQGVMIPASNVSNLMLKQEIVDAVQAGKFHIWPVRTIDEGIEVLTGIPAGEKRKDGSYLNGTINALTDRRLLELAETLVEFGDVKTKKDQKA